MANAAHCYLQKRVLVQLSNPAQRNDRTRWLLSKAYASKPISWTAKRQARRMRSPLRQPRSRTCVGRLRWRRQVARDDHFQYQAQVDQVRRVLAGAVAGAFFVVGRLA